MLRFFLRLQAIAMIVAMMTNKRPPAAIPMYKGLNGKPLPELLDLGLTGEKLFELVVEVVVVVEVPIGTKTIKLSLFYLLRLHICVIKEKKEKKNNRKN